MLRTWHTQRLLMRQLGPHSARLVQQYGLKSQEYHRPWDPVRPADFWERRVVADRLAFEIDQSRTDHALVLYLSLLDDPDRIIGRIAVANIVRGAFQSCTVGYGLAPDVVGNGYMTEALEAVTGIAFTELGLHRVEVNVIPRNSASLGVVERCGFRDEGIGRRYLNVAGEWEDHVRFARTCEEWEGPAS